MPWRHMGKWRYSAIFLDLGVRLGWVVSFIPLSLYPRGRSPRYQLDRRLDGPQSRESNLSHPFSICLCQSNFTVVINISFIEKLSLYLLKVCTSSAILCYFETAFRRNICNGFITWSSILEAVCITVAVRNYRHFTNFIFCFHVKERPFVRRRGSHILYGQSAHRWR
jgi:hypothetical protein